MDFETTGSGRKMKVIGAHTGRMGVSHGAVLSAARQVGKAAAMETAESNALAAGKHAHRYTGGAYVCLSGDPVCEAALADRNASIREDEDR